MAKVRDLKGQVFGRLAVTWRSDRDGRVWWMCKCTCGNYKLVRSVSLVAGDTSSCGCLRREVLRARNLANPPRLRHGDAVDGKLTTEYRSWFAMLQRCTNPKAGNFDNYGGRGIKVCKRWRTYDNFLADMGRKPTPAHSLDRRNNERGYYPSNCRWATRVEQRANRRDS